MSAAPRSHVLLRSEHSDGQIGIVEIGVPGPWSGPPLHHHDFDEPFYVLDGELTFQLGDELREAGPGTLTFAPRGSHHTLANLSGRPARYLLVITPAGFERYLARLAAQVGGGAVPAWAEAPYPETVVVGPQIGGDDGPGGAP
jgi:mannose-6-phosphate isomerase-like protein (cupin superfamily)